MAGSNGTFTLGERAFERRLGEPHHGHEGGRAEAIQGAALNPFGALIGRTGLDRVFLFLLYGDLLYACLLFNLGNG